EGDVSRLVRIGGETLAIRAVRCSGGEPLLRKALGEIVAATAELRTDEGKVPGIAITTNALGLDKRAAGLAAAGLSRINISLDTTDPQTFAALSRREIGRAHV